MVGRLAVSYMVNQVRRSEIPWDHLLRPDWIMGESDPYPKSSMQWPRSSDKSQADSLTSPTTFAIHVAYFEGSFPASAPSAGLSASAAASKNRGTDLCSAIDCKASTSLSLNRILAQWLSVRLKLDLPDYPNFGVDTAASPVA